MADTKENKIAADVETADVETWAELRKQGITNREQFLQKFPTMTDWLENWEAMHGAFLGTSAITFKDGRICFLNKFENAYAISFSSPNREGAKDSEFVLSLEGMYALNILYSLFNGEEEQVRFSRALETSGDKTEES